MKPARILAILLLALVLPLPIAGCGSGEDSSTPGRTNTAAGASGGTGSEAPSPTPGGEGAPGAADSRGARSHQDAPAGGGSSRVSHHDSHAGTAVYRTPGGDNSIPDYGDEASGAEFADAAGALHAYMDARVAQDWGAACERLAPDFAREIADQLGGTNGSGGASCPQLLAGLNAGAPTAVRAQEAQVDVDALRAQGESGFLLFSDSSGQQLFIPVRREGGHWLLAAIAPSPIP